MIVTVVLSSATATAEDLSTDVPTPPAVPISSGTWQGELQAQDGCDADGRYTDEYRAPLEAGEWARFWLTGPFDGVMRIRGPSDFLLENDDLVPGTLMPGIEFEVSMTNPMSTGTL